MKRVASRFAWAAVVLLALTVPAFGQQAAAKAEASEKNEVRAFHDAGILVLESQDGSFKWWLDGRVMLDAATYFDNKNNMSNGAEIRRARFGLNMKMWNDWFAQLDVEFVDNAVELKDVWMGYAGIKNSMIRFGQHKEPFGLDTITSSRYITFMERGMIDAFSPDRHIGVSFQNWGKHYQFMTGFYGNAVGELDPGAASSAWGFTGRASVAPIQQAEDGKVLHFGVAYSHRTPVAGNGNTLRVRTRPETHVNRERYVDTGTIDFVKSWDLIGLEAAWEYGSFCIQGEYVWERVNRLSPWISPKFNGYYGFISYFVTGEHRPYDNEAGEFVRVKPKNSYGAFELVARYSAMNLNDQKAIIGTGSKAKPIMGGDERIVTFGGNWYMNANLRLMLNVLRVVNDGWATGAGKFAPWDKYWNVQARLSFNF